MCGEAVAWFLACKDKRVREKSGVDGASGRDPSTTALHSGKASRLGSNPNQTPAFPYPPLSRVSPDHPVSAYLANAGDGNHCMPHGRSDSAALTGTPLHSPRLALTHLNGLPETPHGLEKSAKYDSCSSHLNGPISNRFHCLRILALA